MKIQKIEVPIQSLLQGTSKVTRPTQSLLAGAPYVPSHQTDIRKTFEQFVQKERTRTSGNGGTIK
jgi:hypothetical protein